MKPKIKLVDEQGRKEVKALLAGEDQAGLPKASRQSHLKCRIEVLEFYPGVSVAEVPFGFVTSIITIGFP